MEFIGKLERHAHWLRILPENGNRPKCVQRSDFWNQILSTYNPSTLAPSKIDVLDFLADIPPAFGGPCVRCFEREKIFHSISKVHWIAKCICQTSVWAAHFDQVALNEFVENLLRHGSGQRLFGTEHSLGFGPIEIQDWDEVWVLDDATVPFILRPVDDHYILVGACYVHGATLRSDHCATCTAEVPRQETTEYLAAAQKPKIPLTRLSLHSHRNVPGRRAKQKIPLHYYESPPLPPNQREEPITTRASTQTTWGTIEQILIW